MNTYAKTNFITLRVVHVTTKYPKGAFECMIKRKGFGNRSKQASLNAYDPESAFEIVDLFAEDMAKEFNIPYEKVSLNRLSEILAAGSQRINPQQKEGHEKRAVTLRDKPSLGHIGYFKSDIKKAFLTETADKIKEVISAGLELLEELETARLRSIKNSSQAKENIARAMYQTFIDTGVDTSIYCNDDEIIALFKLLHKEVA